MAAIPPLLCEHSSASVARRAYRVECTTCHSYWDTESLDRFVAYDASYPSARGHFNPAVGRLKVRTLRRWLDAAGVALEGKRVCEVGFGGGTCLPLIAERASRVIGIEANASAIDRVRATGIPADFYLAEALPDRLDAPVDLWLFQDSFEHIPDPARFVDWMARNSTTNAQMLLVAPRADSVSRRLMGRWWPHKLPDHQFHWSRAGVEEFMARRGFQVRGDFFPLKFASPQMFVAHALHKAGVTRGAGESAGSATLAVPFNFGEMGLVFQRSTR